ncbi:MAG: tRNA (adenosine(37)-N6)-dimethylallyltransferase MiaA [Candidatus Solibacter usitatus]|nr:tRNA (adenosine(37)-N6)-dimethylallyltransferase MiaA [Candidatus Solibacter usitatus]
MDSPVLSPLLVVAGPTGTGKSHLALSLAREFRGEIVNCDSLQLYRYLDIGTSKPPPRDRLAIPHHLFDLLNPAEVYNAGDYAAAARPVLNEIAARGALPIVAGGTGFYLRTLLQGLAEGPRRSDNLRHRLERLEARHAGRLHRLLWRLDPETAARMHPNDRNKLVRALEICLLARRPASQVFSVGSKPLEGFRILKLGLDPPRPLLHARIAERTIGMFESGLLDEVRHLLASGIPASAKAFESIGYKECLAALEGRISAAEAVELTTIASRQYAKRQLTWFRKEPGMIWLKHFGDSPQAVAEARLHLSGWL